MLLLGLCFPLLNLGSICLRYGFVVTAVHEAAFQASVSKTFQTNVSATELSAINSANAKIIEILSHISGVKLTSVTTRIATVAIDTNNLTYRLTKLSQPADTSANMYMVDTSVQAEVSPLVTMVIPLFTCPGLTAPMDVIVSERKIVENPQGLDK